MSQNPAIGRIVHYRPLPGTEPVMIGERPAIIVRTWGKTPEDKVQLQVFVDGSNDGFREGLIWRTSVVQGPGEGQFHFHEDCQEGK